MKPLAERFLEHARARRLFPRPGTAVLAVSGGPDSLALLALMRGAAPTLGLELIVAHVDHGIRTTSHQEAQGLRDYVKTLGLPFELAELHLGADTTETEARAARYSALHAIKDRLGARYLVTAHHADDQVETILLRVLRGSAPAGLAGIAAKSRGGLVRPLLPFSKAEIERLTAPDAFRPFEDSANSDPKHLRSWVRTTLLPLLESRLGPTVRADLRTLGRHAARNRKAWDALPELVPELDLRVAPGSFSVARHPLGRYDAPVAAALLCAAARKAGIPLGPRRAARLHQLARRQSGRRVALGEGWVGETAFDRLTVGRGGGATADAPITVADAGSAVFGEFRLDWRSEEAPRRIERGGWTTWVADGDGLEVRAPRAGDRLAPLGGVGHREVRRLLMEARVPRAARAGYPLLAQGETIVWVPGICRSAARLPEPGTPAVRLDVTEYDHATETDRRP